MIRVFIVDDHPVVRNGLRALLNAQPDIGVVGEASEGEGVLRQVETLRPDVVLLDRCLPGPEGPAVATAIRERHPTVSVLALSAYDDDRLLWGMWAAGAVGYVLKDEPLEGILAAVQAAGQGKTCFRPEQVERAQRWWEEVGRKWESLTEREREVLALMVEGRSNREIAAALWISEKTVEAHIGRVLQKLGLTSRTEAALWAVQNGWWKNSGMEKSGISLIDSALLNGL
jgi:DNA-binding NarL/FixJ family response regulator